MVSKNPVIVLPVGQLNLSITVNSHHPKLLALRKALKALQIPYSWWSTTAMCFGRYDPMVQVRIESIDLKPFPCKIEYYHVTDFSRNLSFDVHAVGPGHLLSALQKKFNIKF